MNIGDKENVALVNEYGAVGSQLFINTIIDGEEHIKDIQEIWSWDCTSNTDRFDREVKSTIELSLKERRAIVDLGSLTGNVNIPIVLAFLLGLLAAISPCPMATNITAIAYVTRRVTDRKYAAITGALYTLGRMFSYSVLGILMVVVGLEIPWVSSALQQISEPVLGPVLIVVGLIMLGINRISFGRGSGKLASLGGKVADWGMIGGFLLGVIFALAFCPYSAVLFFGVLIPLALKSTGGLGLPAVYAIGTGLPVLLLGILLSFGVSRVSSWVNTLNRMQPIIRIVVSLIFIGVGIYYLVLWLQSIGG